MRAALVVSDLSYPPREGLHLQSVALLSQLRSRGIDVDLFGYCTNPDLVDEQQLRQRTGATFRVPPVTRGAGSLLLGLRNRIDLLLPRGERAILGHLAAADYDVIHLEGAAACGLLRRASAARTVVSLVDPPSRRGLRMAAATQSWRHRLRWLVLAVLGFVFEVSLARGASVWHVVSAADASYLERAHPGTRIVDIPMMDLPAPDRPPPATPPGPAGQPTVVIYTDLRQPHHVQAVRRFVVDVVVPLQADHAPAQFLVLGRTGPDAELRAACAGAPVRFLGWLEDHTSVLLSAEVVVVPDAVGTGLKTRVLECLRLGKALLVSDVAFEGMPSSTEEPAYVYGDLVDAGRKCGQLLASIEERARLGANARAYVDRMFPTAGAADAWQRLYLERCTGRP